MRLGREEDPAFTIKTMIVQANWPGATVEEMTNQVTDRIERKLQELEALDFTKSYTHARPDDDLRQPQGRHARPRHSGDLGRRCATRSTTSAPTCRRACRARSSTTSSATCSATSTPSPPTASRSASCATMPSGRAREILKIPGAGRVELLGVQDEVDLSQLLDPPGRRARHRPAGRAAKPAGAERGGAVGRRAGRRRAGQPAGDAASSRRRRACAPSISGSTTASSVWPTSPPSRAAMSTRRSRCSASTASRRSASPSA